MNYDPNMTNSGRMAVQTVKLTFACWEYRAERTVEVEGNCKGLSVIESAIYQAWEALEYDEQEGKEYSKIILTRKDGEELECEDEDARGEDWLKDMLVGAEIIAIWPEGDLSPMIPPETTLIDAFDAGFQAGFDSYPETNSFETARQAAWEEWNK